MSAHLHLFQAGADAIQQKRYLDAVQALEAFCRSHADSSSKEYFQARVWLIKAYRATHQTSEAIALCQQLSVSAPPQIQAWAQQALPSLLAAQNPSSSQTAAVVPPSAATGDAENTPPPPPVNEPEPVDSSATAGMPLTPEEASDLLKQGNKALRMNRFQDAVDAFEHYMQGTDPSDKDYAQAQTWLVKAYNGNGQTAEAIALCRSLLKHPKDFIRIWAEKYILNLDPSFNPATASASSSAPVDGMGLGNQSYVSATVGGSANAPIGAMGITPPPDMPKAGRSPKQWVKLTMKGVAGNLALASTVTLSLLFGMIVVLTLSLLLIHQASDPTIGLVLAGAIALMINGLVFLLAPFFMDLVQGLLYGTRWVSLSQIEQASPEAARTLRTICQQKKIQMPRLGMIDDDNPTAFTYGSFPNSARLVVSRGLFTYLDDDEVATVYAHEMGHIVHWDFAVMTIAATLVQITYLIYVYAREISDSLGNSEGAKKIKGGIQTITIAAYIFYLVGEYLVLYLSRTREYYADNFAAEVTGNPNGLSRALVKIAYGILEQGQREEKPSKVIQGTRMLGICDPRSAAFTGTAYRVASDPQKVGKVFLWDMFNPWGWWMELNSTHPLTGKRVRALTTYAEQLGLEAEFNMAQVVQEGRHLSKKRLYGNFILDLLLYRADLIAGLLGAAIGIWMVFTQIAGGIVIVAFALFGFGLGTLFRTFVMYPSVPRIPITDILTLMSDPYASPLRGRLVKLNGFIIGRGDAGNQLGSDFKMQDNTGMVFLRYASRFGPLGNLLFGMTQAEGFINQEVAAVGWFRRGIGPWVDLMRMDCPRKWTIHSYHRFWSFVLAAVCLVLSFVLPTLAMR